MSGHSKWHSIRHKKAIKDARRGRLFTKILREITVAAKTGGADEALNPRLKAAVAKAKANNVPQDNIKKAIMRGTGELEGVNYEEVVYEGYGPGGVALLIECLTDNKNRTASEMRYIMSRNNGSLGTPGSVAWKFKKKGVLIFSKEDVTEDELMEKLIDAGLENIEESGDTYEVTCDPSDFEAVKKAAEEAGLTPKSAELTMLPVNLVKLDVEEARKAMKLLEALDDHDDVQNVYTDLDIPEELAAGE